MTTPPNPAKPEAVNQPCVDAVVEAVVADFRQRSEIGVPKYGTTLADAPRDPFAYMNHLQKEMMDAIIYAEKWKRDSLNYERPAMLATLFAWCEGNREIEVRWTRFGFKLQISDADGWPTHELEISLNGNDAQLWSFGYHEKGCDSSWGDIESAADLLSLLSRLVPEGAV